MIETDIIAYYLMPNSMNDTVREFGLANRYQLKRILTKNGITEHSAEIKKALRKNNAERTCLAKYGVKCNFASEDPKLNGKTGLIKKYGVEHPLQSKRLFDKMRQTKVERYGDESYNNTAQTKATRLKKYGRDNVGEFGSPEHDAAMIAKYGTKDALKNEALRKKAEATCLKHYGVKHPIENKELNEKRRQTMLTRHGVEGMLQMPDYYRRAKDGMLRKYGVLNSSEIPGVREKISETWQSKTAEEIVSMRKKAAWKNYCYNGEYFDSLPELSFFLYNKLVKKNNIKRSNAVFVYKFDNKAYKYLPDFEINGKLIEIKGDHLFRKMLIENTKENAKYHCMLKNNVRIMTSKDYNAYVNWFYSQGYKKENFVKGSYNN